MACHQGLPVDGYAAIMGAPRQGSDSAQQPTSGQSLSRAACLALLAAGGQGRVASTMRAVPVIIAVRFILFGEDVVFSPGPGAALARAIEDAVVAFETDGMGDDGRLPWDVHVTGVARTFSQAPRAPGFRLSGELMTGWQSLEDSF